jgi:Uma2 family endonuclease
MTTISSSTSSILRDAVEGRATLLPWNVEQYHWAIRSGYLEEDPAYELLDGWIVRKDRSAAGEDPMTIGDRHRISVMRLVDLGARFKPHGCFLQSQQPISLPPRHEPEPDAAIIRGELDNYRDGPPGPSNVLCVIEVADASLRRDRTVKLKAYASAGIPMYVVVNLVDNQVELYSPQPAGGDYAAPRVLRSGDVLTLPTATAATVNVPVDHVLP